MRQQQLAKLVGVHETVLSKVVNGSRRASPQLKKKLADALNADAAWLFETAASRAAHAQSSEPGDDTARN